MMTSVRMLLKKKKDVSFYHSNKSLFLKPWSVSCEYEFKFDNSLKCDFFQFLCNLADSFCSSTGTFTIPVFGKMSVDGSTRVGPKMPVYSPRVSRRISAAASLYTRRRKERQWNEDNNTAVYVWTGYPFRRHTYIYIAIVVRLRWKKKKEPFRTCIAIAAQRGKG